MLDILGILIGFVAIILLLSILATALVQAATTIFKTRRRAFAKGLASGHLPDTPAGVQEMLTTLPAHHAVTRPVAAASGGAGGGAEVAVGGAQEGLFVERKAEAISNLIAQPVKVAKDDKKATWLDQTELVNPLKAAGADPVVVAAVEKRFEQTKRVMEDKFLTETRLITIAAALVVALAFGVSTPQLLKQLQVDQQFRERAEALGEKLAKDPGDVYRSYVASAGLEARKAFLEKHPELMGDLGEVGVEARSTDDLVADVELALEGHENKDALSNEYRELIEKYLTDEDAMTALRAGAEAKGDLAAFDIQPFRRGTYQTPDGRIDFAKVFGVLVTTVLLAFGAPFWYERLKELVGLKDALRNKKEKAQQEQTQLVK